MCNTWRVHVHGGACVSGTSMVRACAGVVLVCRSVPRVRVICMARVREGPMHTRSAGVCAVQKKRNGISLMRTHAVHTLR